MKGTSVKWDLSLRGEDRLAELQDSGTLNTERRLLGRLKISSPWPMERDTLVYGNTDVKIVDPEAGSTFDRLVSSGHIKPYVNKDWVVGNLRDLIDVYSPEGEY